MPSLALGSRRLAVGIVVLLLLSSCFCGGGVPWRPTRPAPARSLCKATPLRAFWAASGRFAASIAANAAMEDVTSVALGALSPPTMSCGFTNSCSIESCRSSRR